MTRNAKKLYKDLLSENSEDKGFIFLRHTIQKEFTKELSQNKIPKTWLKIYFKIYSRLEQIFFGKIRNEKNPIFSLLEKRKSERDFKGEALTLENISKILYFSAGIKDVHKIKKDFSESRRMYPSAGARYPLEVYPIVLKAKGISPGIYHYNIKWNSLEILSKGDFKKNLRETINHNWIRKCSLVIIITAVSARTIIKYKERGWRYILFEAGHLSQNIHLVSTSLEIKSCAIGGFLDKKIVDLLDLNYKTETPLYLIALGK